MPALHQTDYQFFTDGPSDADPYYWTQTFYHSDNFTNPTSGPTYNALVDFYIAMQPEGVTRNGIRSRRLDPIFHDYGTFTFPYDGTRVMDSGLTLINVPKVVFTAGGEDAGYKRWRFPLQYSEFESGMLTSGFVSLLSDAIDDLMSAANLCNWRGVVFDGYRVEPDVRMWQLRHGTNRRSRVVL